MERALNRKILIIDDDERNAIVMSDLLDHQGYSVENASNGFDGICAAGALLPDLVLLDVRLPDISGVEVCKQLRHREDTRLIPIVMMTAYDDSDAWEQGFSAGADDFLQKPIPSRLLLARASSLLRVKGLVDEIVSQREELSKWSSMLERRVQSKAAEIERLTLLKRFFSPRLITRLLQNKRDDVLQSHRGRVSVLFVDLRGFTSFVERHEPETVMGTLKAFHTELGRLVFQFDATLERFNGDGMMVFLNDPDPVPDHCDRAIALGTAMCHAVAGLLPEWERIGGPEGLGIGIATGEVTLGAIGFEGRLDYAAIGSTTNLASRLCGEARAGEMLVDEETWAHAQMRDVAAVPATLKLKGFSRPVNCMRLVAHRK